jgi:DNA mismatch repair protein MutS
MLLYGTNAVGKTSIIRALGIAVIMAQSGMFVPCETFVYSPYRSIFTRILGNDNLFKGLSTFAVEMSELRVILNYADKNSLVLGDELCSGTETESALSIFVAGILDLHEKGASFIFATHFHEIVGYEEIKAMNGLKICHMSVFYDSSNDCLVYDRKLKEGAGTRMYGLEVCKSLYLPAGFMEKAYEIRNKYHPDVVGGLSHTTTTYNAKKVRGMCEMCKSEIGEETHHLLEQNMADANGFIGHVHKNHPANLMSLCEKCHLKMHHSTEKEIEQKVVKKVVRKKTTKGYMLSSA